MGNNTNKYRPFDETTVTVNGEEHTLFRVLDWENQKGGWIEKQANLQERAKVKDEAKVMGNAVIFGDAIVEGEATVFGHAKVSENAKIDKGATVSEAAFVVAKAHVTDDACVLGNAIVEGDAEITDDAIVINAFVKGKTTIAEQARVFTELDIEDSTIEGEAEVGGIACVYNSYVGGSCRIMGSAKILDGAEISGDARVGGDVEIYGPAHISGDACITRDSHYFVAGPIGEGHSFVTFFRTREGKIQADYESFVGSVAGLLKYAEDTPELETLHALAKVAASVIDCSPIPEEEMNSIGDEEWMDEDEDAEQSTSEDITEQGPSCSKFSLVVNQPRIHLTLVTPDEPSETP